MHRTHRTAVVVVAAMALLSSACGTRVPHEEIVTAAQGSGVAGQAGTGQALPGQEGTVAGAVPGETGASGVPGSEGGAGGLAGQPGGTGAGSSTQGTGADGGGGSGPGGAAGAGGGGAPIVIGSVGRYSGPGGASYVQAPRALQAWAATVNSKGGIGGRQVKVIVTDDHNDPAQARAKVQELVEKHKAVAITAAFGSTETVNAWKGYVQDKNVPVIGSGCNPGYEGPMMYMECTSTDTSLYGAVLAGAKYGEGNKLGALFCTESSACSYVEDRWFDKGYAERAGLDPVYRAKISLTQPDYTAECIQARDAGVELLSVAGDANTLGRVAASCSRQNFNPQFLQLSASAVAQSITQEGLDNMLLQMPAFPFSGSSSPAVNEFRTAWQKYGDGTAPGPAAALSWASAKIFEAAARKSGEVSSASLIKALHTFKNETFGGLTVPMSYGPSGTSESNCTFFMKGAGGKWTAPNGGKPICW
jgi:branched-chain amino acid transport system substrate-binding protein